MDDKTKLATVRYVAASKRPYFATALFALHLVAEQRAQTMAIDKYGRVYVNAALIHIGPNPPKGLWSVEVAASALVHELGHWLRKHHERAELLVRAAPLDKQHSVALLCNVAEDMEINDDHKSEGLPVPDDWMTPQRFGYPDGLLWEEYYQLLLKNPPQPGKGGSGGGQKGKGSGKGGGQSGSGTLPEQCDCGSGAHGQSRDYELPAPGGKGGEKTVGIGEAEGDLLRQQVAREIQAAASRGSVPAGWRRWAEALLEPPVVPWERELSALVKNAVTMARGMVDYSYAKTARRGSFYDVIMPAFVRPNPDAAVVVDTSGSMGGAMLVRALTEIKGILRAVGQRKVPVLCCDAAVHGGVQRVSSALQVELAGGGGTDMGVGIAAAQQLRASVIIVLTDGYTPWPAEPPRGCQLVIGVLNPDSPWEQSYPPPPYARRVLRIRDPKVDERAA